MSNHKGNGGFMIRGGIEYPIDTNPNHINSDYWLKRRNAAMDIILANPHMEKVWDSEMVPDRASVMLHALLAEKIVNGEIMPIDYSLPAAPVLKTMDNIEAQTSAAFGQAGEELGTRFILTERNADSFFDVPTIAENIRTRSAELQARIAARAQAAQSRVSRHFGSMKNAIDLDDGLDDAVIGGVER